MNIAQEIYQTPPSIPTHIMSFLHGEKSFESWVLLKALIIYVSMKFGE